MIADRLLDIVDLSVGYNRSPTVRDMHLHVNGGEVVALLGANGAGKTTTLLAISGFLVPIRGRVTVAGAEVSHRQRHGLAGLGVAHVPDDRGIFQQLTVRENLLVDRRVRRDGVVQALEMFPALVPLIERRAGLLSGGEQQMLALGRAIAARPRLLLLDEMSHGLAPLIVDDILRRLTTAVKEVGCSVIIVEQHVQLALELADRAYVLSNGRVALEGSAVELASAAADIESAYLGVATEADAP